jgi:hypothetical protein
VRRSINHEHVAKPFDRAANSAHYSDVAEFSKYADLRERYFGSPSQWNATAPVPQLPGDFLVQVEAFALIR